MPTGRFAAVFVVTVAVSLGAQRADAETVKCTAVTAAPAVIATPGVYCLTQSLVTNLASGTAISINANNVVLDLNGYRLANSTAGPGTTAVGVSASGRQNVTIRNGIVRGFFTAISLTDGGNPATTKGYIVEEILADANTSTGMRIEGAGSIVRNNRAVATGGTTTSVNADVWAIVVQGAGTTVANNEVDTVTGVGTGISTAIGVGTAGGFVVNNRISRTSRGIVFAGTGKYRDNLAVNVSTPYVGGTDAGNNN